MINKEKTLQQRMRENDKTALDFIYREYKDEFINYALRFNLSLDDLEDIFQDSIIAMYQSFVIKQTVLKSSGIKTYLYGIGKNMIYNRFKIEFKTKAIEDTILEAEEQVVFKEKTNEELLLAKYFQRLGEGCKEIINLYYYRGLTIKEIVEQTDYKDENTIKSHKSRCLKTLREKIAND